MSEHPSPDPETVADPAMAAMAGQVEMAWQMMLGQATAAGRYARFAYSMMTGDLRNDAVNWQTRNEPGAAGYRETDT
jgi:hypothetical protein